MAKLTREERETVIITNEEGQVTVYSLSPTMQRRLRKRLGKPTCVEGDTHTWEGLTTETISVVLPRRRSAKPVKVEG